jgi:chaperone LolA
MKYLMFFLVMMITTISYSQTADEVLKSIQNKFDTVNDLTADLIQKANGKKVFSGKIYFKKENKLRFEFGNQTIITDGKTTWNYYPKEKKLVISNFEDKGMGLLSINYLIYQYSKECNLSLEENGANKILVLKPKQSKKISEEIKLFVTKDNLIEKILISETSSNYEFNLSNYKLNQNILDSKFIFTTPEGSTVVDLR